MIDIEVHNKSYFIFNILLDISYTKYPKNFKNISGWLVNVNLFGSETKLTHLYLCEQVLWFLQSVGQLSAARRQVEDGRGRHVRRLHVVSVVEAALTAGAAGAASSSSKAKATVLSIFVCVYRQRDGNTVSHNPEYKNTNICNSCKYAVVFIIKYFFVSHLV